MAEAERHEGLREDRVECRLEPGPHARRVLPREELRRGEAELQARELDDLKLLVRVEERGARERRGERERAEDAERSLEDFLDGTHASRLGTA